MKLISCNGALTVFHKIEYILHTTLIFTGKANIVRYLCAAGANLTMRGDDGMTCLHLAAQNGHLECVHVIMGQNNLPRKFLNLQDEGGWTPLVWACENKHEEVIGYVFYTGSWPENFKNSSQKNS